MTIIKILDCLGLLFFCLFIYWLSDQPSIDAPMWFPHQDKVHHFTVYFILAILVWRAFRHFCKTPIILALAGVAFCSLYGLSDEFHQSFVEGRTADAIDWVADSLGGGLAVFSLYQLRGKLKFG